MSTKIKLFCCLAAIMIICVITGCSAGSLDGVVSIRDTVQKRPVTNKTLSFRRSRDSWIPMADVPLSGPSVEIVDVPLVENGEARVHLRRGLWWVVFDEDNTRSGHNIVSIYSKDIKRGGEFRFVKPPPTIGDTNVVPSQYVLIIRKP